jgi:hypothetical protein
MSYFHNERHTFASDFHVKNLMSFILYLNELRWDDNVDV